MSKLHIPALEASLHAASVRWQRFIARTTMGPMGTGTEAPTRVPMSRDRSHPGR